MCIRDSTDTYNSSNSRYFMKYLLVSDIHGCLPTLEKVLSFYDKNHCDMLCILGDILNYGPRNTIPEGINAPGIVAVLNKRAKDIIAVRGNCEAEVDQMLLHFPVLSDYTLIVDNGKKLFLTHGHIYNKENMPQAGIDAIIYGHTHLWELSKQNSILIANTGSITFPKGGNEPTFMTYENGLFTVFNLNGKILKQENI